MGTSSPLDRLTSAVRFGRAERARESDRRWPTSRGLVLLVADPDSTQQVLLPAQLQASGVSCTWCQDGVDALVQYGRLAPDALLVSPLLDVVDAPTVVRAIRERSTLPILLGVGPGEAALAGPVLLAGASVAVARPYESAEIVRRLEGEIPNFASRVSVSYGPLVLDPDSYSVRLNGAELADLPLKEFELLRLLMINADRVVTTEQIRAAVWGESSQSPSANTIAVHVARLRSRLGGPTVLRTIRGRGYRLTFPET